MSGGMTGDAFIRKHPMVFTLLLIVGAIVGGLAITIAILPPPPTSSADLPWSGLTAADVRPLFERLGLEPPRDGELIWPSMVRVLTALTDRIERLEEGQGKRR